MKNSIRFSLTIILACFSTIIWCSNVVASNPFIFYQDLICGPNIGGVNNKGAFVTIWGKGFGTEQGTAYVTIGSGRADNYPVWSDNKITFQIGNSATSGNLSVTTSDGTSNPMPFTVNDVPIYFVNGEGALSGTGTYLNPWRSATAFINYLEQRGNFKGAILYFRAGTYIGNYGETTWNSSNFMLTNSHKGSANSHVAYIAYPGESVTIINSSDRPNFQLGKGAVGTASDYTTISQFILNNSSEAVYGGGTDRNNEEGAIYIRVIGCKINGNYGSANTMTGLIEISGDHNYILGNEFKNNAPSAINNNHAVYVQGGADNVYIGFNNFYNMKMGHVIQVHSDGGENLVYENIHVFCNTLKMNNYNDTRGFNAGLINPQSYGYIYNNTFSTLGQDFSAVTIYNGKWFIYNNTFYNIRARSSAYSAAIVSDGGYGGGTSNPQPYVKNNIIQIADGQSAYLLADRGGRFVSIDHNIYYGNGLPPFPIGGQTDSNAITSDPMMMDPVNDNFSLQAGSPAANSAGIDASSDIPELIFDKVLNPRNGNDDIGAYEYGATLDLAPGAPRGLRIVQ